MIRAALIFCLLAGTALAEQSLRPVAREASPQQPAATGGVELVTDAPRRRGFWASLRPNKRTEGVRKRGTAAEKARRKGMVCGDPAIQGVVVGRVPGKLRGCGVDNAVKLRSVSGVALSTQSVMDCGTAKALKSWVNNGMQPAFKRRGGVKSIRVVAHYACRTRNNQRGAKISEHGKGRAIDIAGFTLKDGSTVSVLKGWGSKRDGTALRKMHKAACGPFGTVLGPNANRFHRDHFHFDTARYRSGRYCR